jgi:hypothetical protein
MKINFFDLGNGFFSAALGNQRHLSVLLYGTLAAAFIVGEITNIRIRFKVAPDRFNSTVWVSYLVIVVAVAAAMLAGRYLLVWTGQRSVVLFEFVVLGVTFVLTRVGTHAVLRQK